MKQNLVALLFVAVLASPATANAQNPMDLCAPGVRLRRAELVHQGQPGLWLEANVARCLLADVSEVGRLRLARHDLELRIDRTDEHVELLAQQILLAEQATHVAQDNLLAAVRGQREAQEALDAWHRAPALWTGVGVALVLVVGLIAAVYFEALANWLSEI